MIPLIAISGEPTEIEKSLQQLRGIFDVQLLSLDELSLATPGEYTLVDIEFKNALHIVKVREWLRRKPSHAKVVFVIDRASRLEEAQAGAIGATCTIHRPIDAKNLLAKLWGDFSKLIGEPQEFLGRKDAPGVAAAVDTLQEIFSTACLGAPLNAAAIETAGDCVVAELEAQGLDGWINAVRTHHSQTYQHCLLVTGLAAAFGQHLGVCGADRNRLSVAGMLHDIGKARIPVAILEKPGPLDRDELAIMRKHPEHGLSALATVPSLQPQMLDMVVHHHEYLDGSGYPHGLSSSEIGDLVRIITIADVFGALIERRSYKPPLTGQAAYQILCDMGPKLDRDLVREFRFASEYVSTIAA